MINVNISGFADEIDADFARQLQVVKELGMRYICLRSAYGKGINAYTAKEFAEKLLPLLQEYGIGLSSIGSSVGKVELADEEGFERQKKELKELCAMARQAGCRYIRVFSFFVPKICGQAQEDALFAQVSEKLRAFVDIAGEEGIILLHENEKGIFGDTGDRCLRLLKAIDSPNLRGAFDFANFVQCGEAPMACWDMLKTYTVYIHIKDALAENGVNVVFGSGDGLAEPILRKALLEDGYSGFLTLEPHLVQFALLDQLEPANAAHVRKFTAENGEQGYRMQYAALTDMLERIGKA